MKNQIQIPVPEILHSEVITDILSQAITGELVGMSNFATLAGIIDDVYEKMECVEHANCERNHAEGYLALCKKYGLEPVINLKGYYWKSVRECFLKYAQNKDFIGCLIIQEVMLECFAVSMYHDVGKAIPGEIGEFFLTISKEEEEHIEHCIDILKAEMAIAPNAFTQKVEDIHKNCMFILAEWTAGTDLHGHCGVCKGECMKKSLPDLNLSISRLRGNAMNLYLRTLDKIGLPSYKTIEWVINLPA